MNRVNPGRKLNEDETRVYAAGMNAHKRNEDLTLRSWEKFPQPLRKFWWMGWRRAGRKFITSPRMTSTVFLKHGHRGGLSPHMIRTEALSLEEAVDLIELRQRRKRAKTGLHKHHAAKHPNTSVAHQMMLHKARQNSPIGKKIIAPQKPQAAFIDERYEASLRMVERIKQAIQALTFSIEEMNNFPKGKSAVSPKHIIDLIHKLAFAAKIPVPEILAPQPTMRPTKKACINCGQAFIGDGDTCEECSPTELKEIGRKRREHNQWSAALKQQAKALALAIKEVEDKIHERHG